MNLNYYKQYINFTLALIICYTLFILYTIRIKLYSVISSRKNNIHFIMSLIIFVLLFALYFYFRIQLMYIKGKHLSGPDKETFKEMEKNLNIFRGALVNGLAAVFISILALADTFMPSFFMTVIVYYYSTVFI
jgi:hypothetical protein